MTDTPSRRSTDDLTPLPASIANIKLYVGSAIVLSIVTASCAVCLAIFAPANTATMTTILSFMIPTITALIGAGIYGTAVHINGRVTQLLHTTAEKERLKGLVEGLKENPNTNIS